MLRKIVLTGFFLLLQYAAMAQDCKELLLRYVEEIGKIERPEAGKVYYVNLTIRNLIRKPGGNDEVTYSTEMYLSNSQMVMETQHMAVYQDTTDAFVVLPAQKKIIWAENQMNPLAETLKVQMSNFQKEIIRESKVGMCKEMLLDKQKVQLIDLTLPADLQKKYKIKYLTYYLDKEKGNIKRMDISYVENHPLGRQSYIYHTIDFNYKKWKPQPVKEYFLTGRNELKSRYKGYTLIENKES